jgi:hypothetical protein
LPKKKKIGLIVVPNLTHTQNCKPNPIEVY